MSCPALIEPACVVGKAIGSVAGAAAGSAASGALNGIASAIQGGVTWIVGNSLDWWVKVPSPDLASEPAVGQLQQWMLPIAVAVAVLGMIIAGGKMALTRKANPLIDVGSGLVIITATSAVGVLLPSLLLKAGDAWSTWVLNASTGGQFATMMTTLLSLNGAAPAVVVVLGIVAIIVSTLQTVLMLFRQAALVVLAGTLPLAAAGTLTPATRTWFRRVTAWMLALIFYKPAAAAVYAAAFTLIGAAVSIRTLLMGFAMVVMSLLALPALMRFFTWTTGQVTESAAGGGFFQAMLGGAIAIGAVRGAAGGFGGASAAEQARVISYQLGPADGGRRGAQPPGAAVPQAAATATSPGGPATPAGSTAPSAGAGTAATAATTGAIPGAAARGSAAGTATAASASPAAAAGPVGLAAAGLATGAATASRRAAEAMQPPTGEGSEQP